MDRMRLMGAIEAVLFVAGDPVTYADLANALEISELELQSLLEEMNSRSEGRGLTIRRYGDHLRMETLPEYAPQIERLLNPVQKQKISNTIMETLAVIAYKQPVTRGEIEQIRGVKCDYSVQALLAKGLIREAGQRDTLGHPMTFATTDAFLRHFGLSDINDLPPMPETLAEDAAKAEAEEEEPLTP